VSTITGTIVNENGQRASQIPISFRYLSNPAIASGAGVYFPAKVVSTDTSGQFSTVLPMGTYDMTVGGLPVFRIVVPDDSLTYDFINRLDPETTVTQSVENPLAVLGLWIKQNESELRAVTNTTANRLAVLYSPSGSVNFWRWSASSTATDDGVNVLKPNDTDVSEAGRWLAVAVSGSGGGSGQMDYVASLAALTALPGSSSNKLRAVTDTEAPHKLWYYVHGELATSVDGVNILRGDDNTGNWHAL
jgi:hypothetical protein